MKRSNLVINDPCNADWSGMTPNERGRHCASCALTVHDLSTMTEAEAKALFRERRNERVCVRYLCDESDAIVFRKEPEERLSPKLLEAPMLLRRMRRGAAVIAAAAAAASVGCSVSSGNLLASDAPNALAEKNDRRWVMGEPEYTPDDASVDGGAPSADSGGDASQDDVGVQMGGAEYTPDDASVDGDAAAPSRNK
jgi:hypothetical protein